MNNTDVSHMMTRVIHPTQQLRLCLFCNLGSPQFEPRTCNLMFYTSVEIHGTLNMDKYGYL